MSFYMFTTDTMLARDNAAYTQVCDGLRPHDAPGLVAVWASRFGALNRILILQRDELGEAVAEDGAPPLPKGFTLQDRERTRLRAMRDYAAPAGDYDVQELRAYDVAIGEGDRFEALMRDALETRIGYSPNFGVWRAVSGRVDRIYHLWGYRSLGERDEVRARLKDNVLWQRYTATILPMLQSMHSTLLTPLATGSVRG